MKRFLFVLAVLPGAALAQHAIPAHCGSDEAIHDAMSQIPSVLDMGPDAAHIVRIDPLADVPKVMAYPAINGEAARYTLECPVKVTWSNKHVDYGKFKEWQDPRGQVRVSFGRM